MQSNKPKTLMKLESNIRKLKAQTNSEIRRAVAIRSGLKKAAEAERVARRDALNNGRLDQQCEADIYMLEWKSPNGDWTANDPIPGCGLAGVFGNGLRMIRECIDSGACPHWHDPKNWRVMRYHAVRTGSKATYVFSSLDGSEQ